jgi:hypothetical protein
MEQEDKILRDELANVLIGDGLPPHLVEQAIDVAFKAMETGFKATEDYVTKHIGTDRIDLRVLTLTLAQLASGFVAERAQAFFPIVKLALALKYEQKAEMSEAS